VTVPIQKISGLLSRSYTRGKSEKENVDWIVVGRTRGLFLECKVKRSGFRREGSLTDLTRLRAKSKKWQRYSEDLQNHFRLLNNKYSHFSNE